MWKYNNKIIRTSKSWVDDDGVQHPPNWHLWSNEEKVRAGLVWEEPQNSSAIDRKFYNPDGTPKNLDDLKTKAVKEIKEQASHILKKTDWYVIRYSETGIPIPQDILDFRSSVRSKTDEIEASLQACSSHEEFVSTYRTKIQWVSDFE